MTRAAHFVAANLLLAVAFRVVAGEPVATSAETSQQAASLIAVQPVLKVPDGFSIELAAGPPLVARPITGAFDDEGRLYVAESSGSNDPVEKQLEEKPHRIVRLEDTDGDGKFDRRVVFADRMMFPEGTMFLDGSLYVSAPPSIWKLTDTDGDGAADERVEWFQGKTLTGCANDLHGPYLGPDGWVYWCKGAFAEQTHTVNGREWKSRAAHIFRCRPDGTGFEPVMTGGMDNPVDIAFTPDGERILSATYFSGNPRIDGLAHAVYGGVYGKQHGVLDGHPRTGPLMPLLAPMSPAAPCGLERYDSSAFGDEYRDNYFLCQFNLRKVSRHVLQAKGSTYVSDDSDFVVSDNVDFHPTDVLVDADGSLLVIDTGGWYKLCCPTSQLWKPDVLGGIYRVRRIGAVRPADPRGRKIDWDELSVEHLWDFLAHGESAIRQRASRAFVGRRGTDDLRAFVTELVGRGIVQSISMMPGSGKSDLYYRRMAALTRTWALSQLESAESRLLVRQLLDHADESVRHAALQSISLYRDKDAAKQVRALVASDTRANRRVAAEALGRIGGAAAVSQLLTAAERADDRILQHSMAYALIELAEPQLTASLIGEAPRRRAVALVALDQMPGSGLMTSHVVPLLNSDDEQLRETARWLVSRHAEWGGETADWFREQLATLPDKSAAGHDAATRQTLAPMLVEFASHPVIQKMLADVLNDPQSSASARRAVVEVIGQARLSEPPEEWRTALAAAMKNGDPEMRALAVGAARRMPGREAVDDALNRAMRAAADSSDAALETRVVALSVVAGSLSELSDSRWQLLKRALSAENPVAMRGAAADAVAAAPLSERQLTELCGLVQDAGPLELNRLLPAFAQSRDEAVGMKLLSSLKETSALRSLRMDVLRVSLDECGPAVQASIDELEALVNLDAKAQRKRIEELLPQMNQGDVRRGHAVFHSAKATCSACHKMGHAGGTTGPELSRIGEARTERDLLESILYPSLSFVRSYEPVLVLTVDGRTINGTIVDETEEEYVLATGVDQQVRMKRDDVEEMEPSILSIMPGGLDGQLSVQELADLVAFLKNATGK